MDSQYTYMVCIRCMTFNHHAYIEDAMNGFCIQKTNFPFVCIIVDDASTDGEQEVIKKYFDTNFDLSETGETDNYVMTFGRHKTNENCYFAVLYLKYNHYRKKPKLPYFAKWYNNSKYVALCEGDDYWIDERKLQMQVDFLEENEEYGMCYTKVRQFVQKYNKFFKQSFGETIDGFEDLLKNGNRIPTLTVCYRKNIEEKYREEIQPSTHCWLMGDYPMWLYYAQISKIKFLDFESSVYRILDNSACHSLDIERQIEIIKSFFEIKKFFSIYYNVIYSTYEIDYNKAVTDIYLSFLKVSYNEKEAKVFRMKMKNIFSKNIKYFFYYVFSYNVITWTLLMKVVNLLASTKYR